MKERTRILVSWVGYADLLGWAPTLPAAQRSKIEKITKRSARDDGRAGPVRAAVDALEFHEVHLIADLDSRLLANFGRWIGPRTQVHPVRLDDPTDYAAVFVAADDTMASIYKTRDRASSDLWIALSSGTPSMAATLLLLGKSRYPARFLQSFEGKASETDVPFDLTVDFLPDLLQEPDANLQLLADKSPSEVRGFNAIVGDSRAIRLAVGRAKRAAVRDVSVLILGESGTGKELFAQAVHKASRRADGPFETINCAGIPPELQESILFGHKEGTFTGANQDQEGAFSRADGGTLFLDEFGELDARNQAVLLRALQPAHGDPSCMRTFRPLGGKKDETADVRIIAATNRDPQQLIRMGSLRDDLLYRVATFSLVLPPLRDRRSDTGAICHALMSRINAEFSTGEPGYKPKRLSPAGLRSITRQNWPGNVRQLNNVLVQAAVLCDGSTIGQGDIDAAIAQLPSSEEGTQSQGTTLGGGFNLPGHLDDLERQFIRRAYEEADGVKTRAARLLGLKSYQALDAKLRKLGMDWSEEEAES